MSPTTTTTYISRIEIQIPVTYLMSSISSPSTSRQSSTLRMTIMSNTYFACNRCSPFRRNLENDVKYIIMYTALHVTGNVRQDQWITHQFLTNVDRDRYLTPACAMVMWSLGQTRWSSGKCRFPPP